MYRLEVVGTDRLPVTGPMVIAPNHDSVLDGIILGAAISRELRFLGKAELWQSSLPGWVLAGVGGVFGAKLVTQWGVPFWWGFVAAAVVGGVVALVLAFPALRLEGASLGVVTLGFAVAAAAWLYDQSWFKGTGVLSRPSYLSSAGAYYYVAVAFFIDAVLDIR